jgi:hypothetical protein
MPDAAEGAPTVNGKGNGEKGARPIRRRDHRVIEMTRGAWLSFYAWLLGYRYIPELKEQDLCGKASKEKNLKDLLRVPCQYTELDDEVMRSKATASLAAAGVFLALSGAVLAAIMSSPEYRDALGKAWRGDWLAIGCASFVVMLLCSVVRQERRLSARGKRTGRYVMLIALLLVSLVVFLIGPQRSSVVTPAFLLAGFLLLLVSVLLLVVAVNFYDSAAGWRGGDEKERRNFRFHLAGLASHSYSFGLSCVLLGASLLIAQINLWMGSYVTLFVLLTLVGVTELERELWARR